MNPYKSYIIRVYRFEKDSPRNLVGLVEEPGTKGKRAFNTYDELWEILNSSKEHPSINPNPPFSGVKGGGEGFGK